MDHRVSPQTLTSPQAARYIGMSDSWLRQSRMTGLVESAPPYIKIGRAVRYLRDDLDAWLKEHRKGAGACSEARS